ncbi:glycosyltransferase [Candidatus Hydrogenedentota bacterium]
MRICCMTSAYPDFPGAFRGSFVWKSNLLLKKLGCDIVTVTPLIFDKSRAQEEDESGPVIRFPFCSGNRTLFSYRRIPVFRMPLYLISGMLAGLRAIRVQKSDVIVAHWLVPTGPVAVLCGLLTRKPVVLLAHGTDVMTWGRKAWLRPLFGFLMRRSAAIVVNSEQVRDELVGLGADIEKTVIVRACGVDTTLFSPDTDGTVVRQEFKIPSRNAVVLFVGGLNYCKAIDVLIHAFAEVSDEKTKLLLVGSGDDRENLEKLAAELEISKNVIFAGSRPPEAIPGIMAASDIFVLPSRQEGMGLVVLEAMASGKPIVASRAGGIPSIVTDGTNGILFDTDDPDDLAEKLTSVLNDRALREELAVNARRSAIEKYSSDIQARILLDLLEKVAPSDA